MMAGLMFSTERSRPEPEPFRDSDDDEQMRVLTALLGCLIVAEQDDAEAILEHPPA